MRRVRIQSMRGLGDNIYQRAFVRQFEQVYIDTPWPELYQDLPGVRFLRPVTTLRTQSKNINKNRNLYIKKAGGGLPIKRVSYGKQGIIMGMIKSFRKNPMVWDLPRFDDTKAKSIVSGKYAFVRPVTVRKEWPAASRNPDPRYLFEAVEILKSKGYTTISIADLEPQKEWLLHPECKVDIKLHNGNLNIQDVLSIFQNAAVCVGPVGWILPAAICSPKVRTWIIGGGYGAYNAPELLTPGNVPNLHHITPDHFCRCDKQQHECNKTISRHGERFEKWINLAP